jgi:3-methyladenine DNA glycosylase AlkD
LAEGLWATGNHEARLLAGIICPVETVDEELAEAWVADFDSWDICDLVMDLFCRSDFGWRKAVEWCGRPEEFVRRTGFGMFAWFAVRDKAASNAKFVRTCFPRIRKHAEDERNFVKKAVNWALRNIGKRNRALNAKAIDVARTLADRGNSTARWIGKDALRELTSEKVQARLKA